MVKKLVTRVGDSPSELSGFKEILEVSIKILK